MKFKFTPASIPKLPGPEGGRDQVIHRDAEVQGLGLRITKGGARSWILQYSIGGQSRRMTLGALGDWPLAKARERARELNREIDQGRDPLLEAEAARTAPRVADLVAEWEEGESPRKRPSSVAEDRALCKQWIEPELGSLRVADVRRADIEALHRKVSKTTPIRANRVLALVSALFSLAVRREWIDRNPAYGIRRNPENKRHRHLSIDELGRLLPVLAEHPNRQDADIIRVLLLTGARFGEVVRASWDQLDLDNATWTKPAGLVKQARLHHVPLSGPVVQLLQRIKAEAKGKGRWVFPIAGADRPKTDVSHSWKKICQRRVCPTFACTTCGTATPRCWRATPRRTCR
jgi:integrase